MIYPKINVYLFCHSLLRYFDYVEDKIHLGIKNKCLFILYFARLLLSLYQICIRMKRLNKFVKTVVDGIQEKKGRNIRVVDLTKIDDTICNYLVICEGNTPTQVHAIAESIGDMMREKQDARPLTVDGQRNSLWIAMDYADIIVHVFVPEYRQFYDIDNLWEDADLTDIPNED